MTFNKWLQTRTRHTALQVLAMTRRNKARLWRLYEADCFKELAK